MGKLIGDGIILGREGATYFLDGKVVGWKEYRERYPEREESPTLVRSKKVKSVALAVHPDQRGEAIDDAAKRGVPTSFTDDGRPVFESREHRKKYMRAYGYYDRDAGYGDAAPQHHKGERAPDSKLKELARRLADKIRVRRDNRLE